MASAASLPRKTTNTVSLLSAMATSSQQANNKFEQCNVPAVAAKAAAVSAANTLSFTIFTTVAPQTWPMTPDQVLAAALPNKSNYARIGTHSQVLLYREDASCQLVDTPALVNNIAREEYDDSQVVYCQRTNAGVYTFEVEDEDALFPLFHEESCVLYVGLDLKGDKVEMIEYYNGMTHRYLAISHAPNFYPKFREAAMKAKADVIIKGNLNWPMTNADAALAKQLPLVNTVASAAPASQVLQNAKLLKTMLKFHKYNNAYSASDIEFCRSSGLLSSHFEAVSGHVKDKKTQPAKNVLMDMYQHLTPNVASLDKNGVCVLLAFIYRTAIKDMTDAQLLVNHPTLHSMIDWTRGK